MRKIICKPYLLLTLIMFLLACKKSNTSNSVLNVHSTVYDFNSKIPKAGVKVYLYECAIPAIYLNTNWSEEFSGTPYYSLPLDSTITNSNGQFNFQFYPRLNSNFYTTPHYKIAGDSLFRVYSKDAEICDDTNKDSIFADKKKYLTVNMQKISTVFPDDSITQYIRILQPISGIIDLGSPVTFIGSPHTRKFYYSYPSCTKVLVEWNYYHPNLQGSGKDTFDLLPNGTSLITSY